MPIPWQIDGGVPLGEYESQIRLDRALAVQIVAWIVAALLTYGAVNARVSVVESKQYENERRLQRIEEKVDRLIEMWRIRP